MPFDPDMLTTDSARRLSPIRTDVRVSSDGFRSFGSFDGKSIAYDYRSYIVNGYTILPDGDEGPDAIRDRYTKSHSCWLAWDSGTSAGFGIGRLSQTRCVRSGFLPSKRGRSCGRQTSRSRPSRSPRIARVKFSIAACRQYLTSRLSRRQNPMR